MSKCSTDLDDDLALPKDGMQVRGEYTVYGHFFFLRKLLNSTEKVRFFLDQDSSFRAACLSAFSERIKEGRCDAFYVRINSEATIDKKRQNPGRQSTPYGGNEATVSRPEGLADKALDDKGEDGPGGQHRHVAGSLGGTSIPEYGRAREGHVLSDGYPGV